MAVAAVVIALIGLAIGVVTLILTAQASNAASSLRGADEQTLGDMRQTEQREGVVVPIVYGHCTITGNMIWWDAEKINNEHYRYRCWQTICMGEIDTRYFYRRELTYLPFYANYAQGEVSHGKNYLNLFVWMDEKPSTPVESWLRERHVDDLNGWAARPKHEINSGTDSGLEVDPGSAAMQSSFFHELPYATKLKGIASMIVGIQRWENQYLISPAALDTGVTQMPTYKYCVRRTKLNSFDNDTLDPDNPVGNNPAAVYYDLLTDTQYGGSVAAGDINEASFQEASDYYKSKSPQWGLNFFVNSVVTVRDVILKIQEWTDSYLVKDINNRYAIKILKDTDISVAEINVDTEQIEFALRRKSWDDTYNCFTGNYRPLRKLQIITRQILRWGATSAQDFTREAFTIFKNDDVETLTIKNEANIQLTGNERMKTVDLTCFCLREVASERLTQIMKKESYPFANANLTTSMEYYFLRVGDVVTITSEQYSISAPFRVVNVSYQKIDENKLTFELLQMREILTDQYYSDCARGRGEVTNAAPPPFIENVTFPAFLAESNPLARSFTNDARSVVYWGTGQLRAGRLEYGTDYTVVNHNVIKLDETIFETEIGFNANGLLNIDVFEDIEAES